MPTYQPLQNTKLIGLCGLAGCGKSTLATSLVRDHGFAQFSFATPIKDALIAMGVSPDFVHTPEGKTLKVPGWGKSSREMMQTLGTEWGRNCVHPEVWVDVMRRKLQDTDTVADAPGRLAGIVIDDVRFENEADMIRELGGTVVRVRHANHATNPVDGAGDAITRAHVSEAGVAPDRVVWNVPGEPERMVTTLVASLEL